MSAAGAIASMARNSPERRSAVCRQGARVLPLDRPARSQAQGERVADMQRRRLLAAVVDIVADDGLEGVTVGAVCRRAGVSRRTFYDLFEDRHACSAEALEWASRELAEELLDAWRSRERWRERVRAGLTVLLQRFDGDRGLARLCLVESLKGGAGVLERRRAALEWIAALIDQGREEAKGRAGDSPALTAESVLGGVLGVLQARVLDPGSPSLIALLNPLMSMIVRPYLGAAAARGELEMAAPDSVAISGRARNQPPVRVDGKAFEGLSIRMTFRTARVLETIGSHPDASNRDVAAAAGMSDQGQASKLLRRLQRAQLIENLGSGQAKGEPNAWRLTTRGRALLETVVLTR